MKKTVVLVMVVSIALGLALSVSSCKREKGVELAQFTAEDFRANFEKVTPGMDKSTVFQTMKPAHSAGASDSVILYRFLPAGEASMWLVATFHMKEGVVESKELGKEEPGKLSPEEEALFKGKGE